MRTVPSLLAVVVAAALVGCVARVDTGTAGPAVSLEQELVFVQRQADGDSFLGTDGVTYRVGMVNTPEVGECWATEATTATALFLDNGFVAQPYDEDRYGRTVARIVTPDGDLGVHLARNGFADDRYLEDFRDENPAYAAELDDAFAAARAEGAGLWSACER